MEEEQASDTFEWPVHRVSIECSVSRRVSDSPAFVK
jgi:hypothetical protein